MTAQNGEKKTKPDNRQQLKPTLYKKHSEAKNRKKCIPLGATLILQPSSSIALIAFDLHSLKAIRWDREEIISPIWRELKKGGKKKNKKQNNDIDTSEIIRKGVQPGTMPPRFTRACHGLVFTAALKSNT